ncbi:hypothetical protein BDY21DRAFT_384532 [Lineolata rhizophorae]|uniref:Uncharacterized protein n=1 Tax=Lineolata rhizophorae TaxID=578093 RepID=A0A6A6P8I9_9PEZI|nr:hypothetical protein BDY21DRAFT_384532 [Lineolata rhizophorae]
MAAQVDQADPAAAGAAPVDPSMATAAQIPLQTFTIPDFPRQAGSLKALTLTSDIKLDEYSNLVAKDAAFTVPESLPRGIESLTLELFSLGYPPGFLTQLAARLPYLKSLVVYSQLLGGVSPESQDDALRFVDAEPHLRALHLLDVFAKPGFFSRLGESLRSEGTRGRGLMFLEVNYSFRHEDEDFLTRVQGAELPGLVAPGLITCAFNIAPPDVTDDPEDPANLTSEGEPLPAEQRRKEGVMAFNRTLAPALVDALTAEETAPRNLKVLNSTLYTLTTESLGKILGAHKGLMVLSATVELEPTEQCKKELLGMLGKLETLEQVEIVGNPSLEFYLAVHTPKNKALDNVFPSEEDMKALAEKCPKLSNFKAGILRTTSMGTVEWTKKGGKWNGGIVYPDPPKEESKEASK